MKLCHRLSATLTAVVGVALLSGTSCPISTNPAGFTSASAARGGQLYDNWWKVNGAATPSGDHPRYPAVGTQSGSGTWRCKECHGWDYKGAAGAYGSGSHFTGIKGLFGTTLDAQGVFDEIKAHNMPGLTDDDIWDLAKFVLDPAGAQYDTDAIISGGNFTGDAAAGKTLFETTGLGTTGAIPCLTCHGADGKTLNFSGDPANPEYVGTVASDNPWEFQHKVRFGQPGEAMPASFVTGGTETDVNNVGAHAETLPTS